MFNFNNYSGKLKCYDDSKKLVVDNMKYETGGVANEKLVHESPKCVRFW